MGYRTIALTIILTVVALVPAHAGDKKPQVPSSCTDLQPTADQRAYMQHIEQALLASKLKLDVHVYAMTCSDGPLMLMRWPGFINRTFVYDMTRPKTLLMQHAREHGFAYVVFWSGIQQAQRVQYDGAFRIDTKTGKGAAATLWSGIGMLNPIWVPDPVLDVEVQ
jgi:hypothetical protein